MARGRAAQAQEVVPAAREGLRPCLCGDELAINVELHGAAVEGDSDVMKGVIGDIPRRVAEEPQFCIAKENPGRTYWSKILREGRVLRRGPHALHVADAPAIRLLRHYKRRVGLAGVFLLRPSREGEGSIIEVRDGDVVVNAVEPEATAGDGRRAEGRPVIVVAGDIRDIHAAAARLAEERGAAEEVCEGGAEGRERGSSDAHTAGTSHPAGAGSHKRLHPRHLPPAPVRQRAIFAGFFIDGVRVMCVELITFVNDLGISPPPHPSEDERVVSRIGVRAGWDRAFAVSTCAFRARIALCPDGIRTTSESLHAHVLDDVFPLAGIGEASTIARRERSSDVHVVIHKTANGSSGIGIGATDPASAAALRAAGASATASEIVERPMGEEADIGDGGNRRRP